MTTEHPAMQGPTENYCPDADLENPGQHAWSYTLHGGLPRMTTKQCMLCKYISVQPIRELLLEQEEVSIRLAEQLAEAQADATRYHEDFLNACRNIAEMHAAAVGEVRGPIRGVVEDVADLRERHTAIEEQIKRLADVIMFEVPGEPSTSDGAVDVAIRLLRERTRLVGEVEQIADRLDDDGERFVSAALRSTLAATAPQTAPAKPTGEYYFAARYSRHSELRGYRDQFIAAVPGVAVTSRWIDCHDGELDASYTPEYLNAHPDECWRHGEADIEDVANASTIVSFTGDGGGGKGGRHIEHGYAIAAGKRLVVIGPRENIFHCHPSTEVYATWLEFLGHESLRASQPDLSEPTAADPEPVRVTDIPQWERERNAAQEERAQLLEFAEGLASDVATWRERYTRLVGEVERLLRAVERMAAEWDETGICPEDPAREVVAAGIDATDALAATAPQTAPAQPATWAEAHEVAVGALLKQEARRDALAEREAADPEPVRVTAPRDVRCPTCDSYVARPAAVPLLAPGMPVMLADGEQRVILDIGPQAKHYRKVTLIWPSEGAEQEGSASEPEPGDEVKYAIRLMATYRRELAQSEADMAAVRRNGNDLIETLAKREQELAEAQREAERLRGDVQRAYEIAHSYSHHTGCAQVADRLRAALAGSSDTTAGGGEQ